LLEQFFFVRLVDLCLLGKGITVCAELSAKPLGTFPLLSSEKGSFCLQRQAAISLLRVCIVTYSGHGRALNLQIGLCFLPSGGCRGWAVPSVLQPFAKLYLDRQKGIFFSGVAGDRFKNKAEVFSLHTPGGDALEVHRIWG
jgi:hypothetical protein